MFGLTGEKLLILGLIAVFVIGPKRLPHYAQQLAKFAKQLKAMIEGAKDQLNNEIGEEVDWKKLDPRQYDPRRIIREALTEDLDFKPEVQEVKETVSLATAAPVVVYLAAGEKAPYDSEAT